MANQIINQNMLNLLNNLNSSNDKLDELIAKVHLVTTKEVYEDFAYTSGKLIGLLRHIIQNPKHRNLILKTIPELTTGMIDLFKRFYGNLPYINKDGDFVEGIEQESDNLHDLLIIIADRLNLDLDFSDVTQKRFNARYQRALEECQKTLEKEGKIKKKPEKQEYDE